MYTIDAETLRAVYLSANNHMCNKKDILNELNVFPVPDGDTGNNMSMTAQAASRELLGGSFRTCAEVAQAVAKASLRGARGNSGVILSQFFRGIAKRLENCELIDGTDLAEAFVEGADAAYRAVMKPTEGTMLTVARDAAKAGAAAALETQDIAEIVRAAHTAAQRSLDKTPELLPQLKAAGVVDSGGQGVVYLLEGAVRLLETGTPVEAEGGDITVKPQTGAAAAQADIKYIYCTEFLIQKDSASAGSKLFSQSIEKKGDSMVVVDDGEIIKVHIHTNHPGYVIEQAVKLGELINIKIDNMKHQHNELYTGSGNAAETKPADGQAIETQDETPAAPVKQYGMAAVAAGDGLAQIFRDMGVDVVIEGGQTMNPSTEDILEAVNHIPAETVFVLPNNKNIVMAAEQCVELTDKQVIVIPSKSVPAGISAALAFAVAKTPEENQAAMTQALAHIKAGSVTFAVRDSEVDGKAIKKGDILGMVENKISCVGKAADEVLKQVVDGLTDETSEVISVFYGADVTEQDAQQVEAYLETSYSDCDILLHKGGQPLYDYIVSVE